MSERPLPGVLLVNLGTPDAPTPEALRRYLAEFLSDPRVVDLPRWRWLPILHGIILRTRPARSARAYERIWTERGSPLRLYTEALGEALEEALGIPVRIAMRYGRPSIATGLAQLREAGAERLLVLPLYPQYSATTTASTYDALAAALRREAHVPEIRLLGDYHRHPAYIDALATRIEDHWREHGRGERLLLSFHGIPRRYAEAGDPYPQRCEATARALARRLGLEEGQWAMSYQSRFGREPWLQPYTDETLARWPGEGVRSVDVVCPGFATDCLETLEEIAMENRDTFLAAGGEAYRYIPALNDRPEHVALLETLVREGGEGWL